MTSQTIWRFSWSPSSGQPSSPWPSTNPPSVTVNYFYLPMPDFSTTTNLLRRCYFVNLSKPPQLRWTFTLVKDYLSEKNIPISNFVSTTADGAPTMMGHQNGILKLLKDDNPDMITVHCLIHRENLVAGVLSPELDQFMKGVIKVINFIKEHPKTERLFIFFCQDMDQDYVRLVLHTQVQWLPKGNCLERFMSLYDTVLEFGSGREVFQFFKFNNTKALICYLADVFGKLNGLNKELQGAQKTLMDCKTQICAFVTKLTFWRSQIADVTFVNSRTSASVNFPRKP